MTHAIMESDMPDKPTAADLTAAIKLLRDEGFTVTEPERPLEPEWLEIWEEIYEAYGLASTERDANGVRLDYRAAAVVLRDRFEAKLAER